MYCKRNSKVDNRGNTLTKTGKKLVWILDKIENNHCLKSINN